MRRVWLLAMLAVAFVGYTAWTFAESVTPYVSVAEAKRADASVQVKGLLDKTAPAPREENGEFIFSLADEETGESLSVRLQGTKPDQFDQAYHIVAIGKYDTTGDFFAADRLLIKCPSKYEAQRSP